MRFLYKILLLLALSVAATRTNAQTNSDMQVIQTKPSGDLTLQVWFYKSQGVFYSTDKLAYDWLTVTNPYSVVFPLDDEYACIAKMSDATGRTVPLRSAHRNLGKKFYDLKYPSVEQPWNRFGNIWRLRPAHGTQETATAEFRLAKQNLGESGNFYTPDELFDITTPGTYELQLQFQSVERFYKGGRTFLYKLERFDPIKVKVIER